MEKGSQKKIFFCFFLSLVPGGGGVSSWEAFFSLRLQFSWREKERCFYYAKLEKIALLLSQSLAEEEGGGEEEEEEEKDRALNPNCVMCLCFIFLFFLWCSSRPKKKKRRWNTQLWDSQINRSPDQLMYQNNFFFFTQVATKTCSSTFASPFVCPCVNATRPSIQMRSIIVPSVYKNLLYDVFFLFC